MSAAFLFEIGGSLSPQTTVLFRSVTDELAHLILCLKKSAASGERITFRDKPQVHIGDLIRDFGVHNGGRGSAYSLIRMQRTRALKVLFRRALIHVATPSCEPAHEEFLGNTGADAFSHSDREIPKDQTCTTIRFGIVKVRDC
jgi:hypothetical protein